MAPQSSAKGGHVGFGSTTARTEWNFAEGFRTQQGCPFTSGQGAPPPPDSIEYLTLSNPGPSDAQIKVTFLPELPLKPYSIELGVAAGSRQTIAPHNVLGSGPTKDFCGKGYGMRVESLSSRNQPAQPIVAERPMYWNRQVLSVFANGGHIVLPMHNLGLGRDPAAGITRAVGDTSAALSQIDAASGTLPLQDIAIVDFVDDISATAGQVLQIEATTRGRPASATLYFTPEGGSSSQRIPMQEVRPDFWRASLTASVPGTLQALAEKTGTYRLSWVSRLGILQGPAISGRVVGEAQNPAETTPVAGVVITAFDRQGAVGQTRTQKDGYYAIPLSAPGPYHLSFLPQNIPGRDEGFADSYTIHKVFDPGWDPIDVPAAGAVYDEVLRRAGRFYGRVTGGETPSQISFSNNRVAFTSRRDGNNEIYVVDADGQNPRRLTNHPADDIWPAFSPDGRRIAFASSRDGNFEIYTMNADGSDLGRLTTDPALDNQPAWSPDGNSIAYVSDRDGHREIYLRRLDQSFPVRLTQSPEDKSKPEWSPDSGWIAYVSGSAIWRIRPDGTQSTQLTEGLLDFSPAWSPDGRKIAFTSLRDGDEEIYVMDAASPTADPQKLTDNAARDTGAAYSLDGQRIFFLSDRHDPGGALEIYQMSPDGGSQQRVTTGAEVRTAPDVGPRPALEVPLGDLSVTLFDEATNRPIGRTVWTAPDGTWEKWVPPGRYYGLVNSATEAKPLGWNGYSLAWSKGQIFDRANGGMITVFELGAPPSSVRYDETLKKVYPVSGRIIPQGGPGLPSGGAAGSFWAISPNGQFAAVKIPQDGNYVYPLPKGVWKIIYVVPGYKNSYYHDTEDLSQAREISVVGEPIQLEDQHIFPAP
jgi:Tol biopolymer transport system component